MRTFNQIAFAGICCILSTTAAFSQSTADAKRAIEVEQFQKAKSLLKHLVTTEPTKDENYFYLGWVYLQQDYADSAKAVFIKGLTANPKSAFNYIGLGMIAKEDNDRSGLSANFTQAAALAGRSDKPYIYMAKAYLMKPDINPDMALSVLDKASKWGQKDPEYFIALGDAYHAKLDNSKAYSNYAQAQTLDPKAAYVDVAIGSLWKQADNYEDATKGLNDALAIDPNYGPAYRELAETDLRWAQENRKVASVKVKEGTAYYKKYLDLTDRSPESEMRYADFLLESGDYKTLEQVADDLGKSSKSNLRIYRYLGYAAYENGNYRAGLDAIGKFIKEAAPKRIIPLDYIYLGHLQLKTGRDSLGILNLEKAAALDSTREEVYSEIADHYYGKHKYILAGDAYQKYIKKSHKAKLNDYFREGMSYYYGYSDEYYNTPENKTTVKPDSTLLIHADSAFSYIQQKTTARPVADVFLYRARVKDLEDTDRAHLQAFAKPFYEEYITLKSTAPPADERTKKNLAEAYAYLGAYYDFTKDENKAVENYQKAKDAYPDNKEAKAFFDHQQAQVSKTK